MLVMKLVNFQKKQFHESLTGVKWCANAKAQCIVWLVVIVAKHAIQSVRNAYNRIGISRVCTVPVIGHVSPGQGHEKVG